VERSQLKQRIVGGLVLVALGAIVIPFLLDMHQEDQWWGKGNIPKKPDNGFVTRVLPLEEWSQSAQSDLNEGAKQMNAVPPAAPPSQGAGQAPASAQPPPAVQLNPIPPSVATAPSSAGGDIEGWVVQLGSFSSQKNAEELRERLQKKAYRVYVENIKQDGQTVYRVRIGPGQRADAETIRDRLAHDLRLKAIVLHIP
jgi:cell division septation protein DedD